MKKFQKFTYGLYLASVVFSFISLLFFTGFYIYKIITNSGHNFYVSAYSIFLGLTLLTAFFDVIFFKKFDDDKETKKAKSKNRRQARQVIKFIKYGVKFLTIVVGITELFTVGFTVGKLVLLLFSINLLIFEVFFSVLYIIAARKLKEFKSNVSNRINESGIKNLFKKKDPDVIEIEGKDK